MTMTPTANFDSTATFAPTINPSAVVLTGSATNTPNIASIVIYDGTTQVGSTAVFSSTYAWNVTVNLAPGLHTLTAVTTSLSGAASTAAAPFQLVMGINNQPYVYQERDLNAAGSVVRVSSFDKAGSLVSQTSVAGNGTGAPSLSIAFDSTATFEGSNGAALSGTTTAYGSASSIEIFDGAVNSVVNPTTGSIVASAKALGYATIGADGTWTFDAHVSPGYHQFTAVAVGLNGIAAAAQSPFDLRTGVVGQPFVYQEIDHNIDGSVAATTSYAKDGTVVGRNNGGGSTVSVGHPAAR